MNRLFLIAFLLFGLHIGITAQTAKNRLDTILPVRGLSIEAPASEDVDKFVGFIQNELVPAHFNLLILRVDWNYDYKSHPELRGGNPLTEQDVKKIVKACRIAGIRIAPQINLLGHQSWAKNNGNLLRVYPELDETPQIKTENYSGWPNPDGLYCKSYCPLHPDVHKIVFPLIDELTEVFETDLFHAGMDEVFYIGEKTCPRCGGRDKAELFAGEVTSIRNHLAEKGKKLMIWGDRLLDGKTTGLGEWEASMNNTHRAIDMIPKDIFICDWHYDRPEPTPVYFALKGLNVAICPYKKPDVAIKELDDMIRFRKNASPETAQRLQGIIATVWSGNKGFLQSYYQQQNEERSEANTLKKIMEKLKTL